MCSFIFLISKTDIDINRLEIANNKIRTRGPNATNFKLWEYSSFKIASVHNLLDISGSSILQPCQINENKFLLFNGEIYSPSDGITPDTKVLNDNFINNNLDDFLRSANGEYALAAINLLNKEVNIYTDLIGTKPLSFAIEKGRIGIASYPSALEKLGFQNIQEVKPNSHMKFNLEDLDEIKFTREDLHHLNLDQDKLDLSEWNKYFCDSIKFRVGHFKSKAFVPLSAGYDSGAICCALNKLKIPYVSISLGNHENKKILRRRIAINKKACCLAHYSLPPLSNQEFNEISLWLKENLGIIKYKHLDGSNTEPISLHEDGGAIGLARICNYMRDLGFNTLISGSGADEIISDYGINGKKLFSHSQFGGLFPEDLKKIFPWKKFYGDSQRSYLLKDEMVSGLFGIEGRYPFLDRQQIQSFINLSSELKNKRYKNCIAAFLDEYRYPYEPEVKDGFNPKDSDLSFRLKIKYKLNKFLSK